MSDITEYRFVGIPFRQNPEAPELFAFVASADTLRKICGVARKSEQMLTNYQRALDEDRVKNELVPFFKIPQNCTPTAIVLSLHNTPAAEVSFEPLPNEPGTPLDLRTLVLRVRDVDAMPDPDVVASAKALLDDRLKADLQGDLEAGQYVPDVDDQPTDPEEVPDEALDEQEEADSEEVEEEVEIGQSMLRDLRNKLEATTSLAPDMLSALRDMLRPALVIDGQHRLFGAAKVEEGIPLLVCSLVNPEWKEQVFQFTVINDKARGIPKPFITSLAGMSLTSTELGQLQTRLQQAGVQLWEVDVMQRLGYDKRSPFANRIEFKVSGSGSHGLGYQTMKQVGKAWYDPKHHGLLALMRVLYRTPGGSKLSIRTLKDKWQKEAEWFEYLCRFWDAFAQKFGDTPLWQMHSSLMTAVVLLQLQETFLTYLDSVSALTIEAVSETDDNLRREIVLSKYGQIVDQFSKSFEAKHFPAAWGIKSLNHKDGKEKLLDYFEKVRQGKHVGNHPLRVTSTA